MKAARKFGLVCLLLGLAACARLQSPVNSQGAGGTLLTHGAQISPLLDRSHLVEYPLPTGNAQVSSIVRGPDGSMWFCEAGSAKIGKISTTGVITEYAVPGQDSQSGTALAVGGSHFLWFVASKGIYKVTTQGVISLAIPGPEDASYTGIAVGPDGNIWTAGSPDFITDETIFKFSPAGGYTEYTTPTPQSGPGQPVVGADGNIWVREVDVNKVAKVTTSGTITEYTMPSGSAPIDVAEGDDGNLYVTDLYTSVLHRVSTSGTVTDFALPSASSGLGQGPHHLIWILLSNTNSGIRTFNTVTHAVSSPLRVKGALGSNVAFDADQNAWFPSNYGQSLEEYTSNF